MAATTLSASSKSQGRGYFLFILTLVFFVNCVDRSIIHGLGEYIKADLKITDARLGFLYGTAFAVCYALFAIPIGRVVDNCSRTRFLGFSIIAWSLMTALSGLSQRFWQLACARAGVAAGEAGTNPCCYSLISDLYPKEQRSSVMAIYYSGAMIGYGVGPVLAGTIVPLWNIWYPSGDGFLDLRGWQAAFMFAALIGLILSVWVFRLQEPVRGRLDDVATRSSSEPLLTIFAKNMLGMLPIASLLASGPPQVRSKQFISYHLVIIGILVAGTAGLIWSTGNAVEWTALGFAVCAIVSWVQHTTARDPVAAAILFRVPSVRFALFGFSMPYLFLMSTIAWSPSYFIRTFDNVDVHIARHIGLIFMFASVCGVVAGGVLGDWWRRRWVGGHLSMGVLSVVLAVPFLILMLLFNDKNYALASFAAMVFSLCLFTGPMAATTQELVLPRMRGVTTAIFGLTHMIIGNGLGPFAIGMISDALGSLPQAMIIVCVGVSLLGILLLLQGVRHLAHDSSMLNARAREAGEPI